MKGTIILGVLCLFLSVACVYDYRERRIPNLVPALIAIYEMLYCKDIPVQVSVNEAVELAKKYDTDDSYTFVNGVLGAADKLINSAKEAE